MENQPKVATIWGIIDSCTYLIITLYFETISNYWAYITFIGYLEQCWGTY